MYIHPFFWFCPSPILQEIREKYERALAMSPELMPWAQGLISKAPRKDAWLTGIMVYFREIIPTHGRTIQVSEILSFIQIVIKFYRLYITIVSIVIDSTYSMICAVDLKYMGI